MFHITHFILFFSFSTGLIATLLSFQIYLKYKYRYLLSGSIFLVCINSVILLHIMMLYFYFNLYRESSLDLILAITTTFTILMPVLYVVAVFFFYSWINGLLRRTYSKKFSSLTQVVCFSIFVVQLIFSYMEFSIHDIPLNYIIFKSVEFLALIVSFMILVKAIRNSKHIANFGQRVSFRRFCRLIMAVLISVMIIDIAYFSNEISSDIYLLLIALLMFAGNIVPIYYYRWFLVRYFEDHGTITAGSERKIDIEQLYRDHNVTSREREIISLICDGKTNKEVADILFVSTQTVKDHIYRVYRKLGVKNRVQLTNLFKGE